MTRQGSIQGSIGMRKVKAKKKLVKKIPVWKIIDRKIDELFKLHKVLSDEVSRLTRSVSKKQKVLVTGGAGFIGSHIVDLLIKKNYDVVVVDNLSSGKKEFVNKKARFYNVDINSDDLNRIFALEEPDFVVHAAAQISVIKAMEDPKFDAYNNIVGTINLLEACRRYHVRKIVFLSSSAVYGDPDYLPIDENHPLKMISPYGISKHTAEHYLYVYYHNYNIDYVVLRLANVYGPRQGLGRTIGVIPSFIQRFLENKPIIIYGDGSQTRDFVFVGDVAEAVVMALKKPTIRKIFNLGSQTEVSIIGLVRRLEKFFNKKAKIEFAPANTGDIKRMVLLIDNIRKELGWKPRTNFDAGLKMTVEWFKKYKNRQKRKNK